MVKIFSRDILSGGIIVREVRAALSAVFAVAALQALYLLLRGLSEVWQGRLFAVHAEDIAYPWAVSSVIMALLLGVLCGAEEEENGTADFPQRLPIPRLRVLAEKIAGSLVAFALWAVLALLLDTLLMALSGRFSLGSVFKTMVNERLFLLPASWGVLLYCSGLVAGAWTRRAVVAAVVGGVGGWVFGVAGVVLTLGGDLRAILAEGVWPYHVFWLGCLLALMATAVRYQTREGT